MSLAKAEIVEQLIKILGEDQVVTDEEVLKRSSVDRFRRFEGRLQQHAIFDNHFLSWRNQDWSRLLADLEGFQLPIQRCAQ